MSAPSPRWRGVLAATAVLTAALAAVVLPALPASAHVTVDGQGARPGADDVVLTFRVPNERSDARTVKVDITFPSKTPIASVKPQVKPGWTVTTKRVTFATPISTDDGSITEGVGEVVFTAAAGGGITEGSFDTFDVLVGPLPKDVTTLSFPAVQTYSNGTTSAWIEPSLAGTEPQHPAPVLRLVRGSAGGEVTISTGADGTTGDGAGIVGAVSPSATAEVATAGEVRTARLIGLIGVGTGVVGLLVAAAALGRARAVAARSVSSSDVVVDRGAGSVSR